MLNTIHGTYRTLRYIKDPIRWTNIPGPAQGNGCRERSVSPDDTFMNSLGDNGGKGWLDIWRAKI